MGELWADIREAILDERVAISVHAALRMRQRGIPAWQVVAASPDGNLLEKRPRSRPNPSVEIKVLLPDGTSAKAVWSWLRDDQTAKLVTVHVLDGES